MLIFGGETEMPWCDKCCHWGLEKQILRADWELCLTDTSQHQSTSRAASTSCSTLWPKLWDMALDHGHSCSPDRNLARTTALCVKLSRWNIHILNIVFPLIHHSQIINSSLTCYVLSVMILLLLLLLLLLCFTVQR